jgi:hypothetical protein
MKQIFSIICIIIMGSTSIKAQDSSKTKMKDSLEVYIGKYKFPEGSPVAEINVALENGILILKSRMGDAPLEKADGIDQFSIPSYQGTASFFRNNAKKVSGIHIDAMGRTLEGEKDETEIKKEEKKKE